MRTLPFSHLFHTPVVDSTPAVPREGARLNSGCHGAREEDTLMETVIAYLVALSLPLWLAVEEVLHRRETGTAPDSTREALGGVVVPRPRAAEAQDPVTVG